MPKPLRKKLARRARRGLVRMGLLPILQPRRIDVCCCGLSKTGTHSMSGLFENYRTAHHPDADVRLDLAIRYLTDQVSPDEVDSVLAERDRHLWLEMESSTLSGILIESMYRVFPHKKYIFTVRDVYSWTESMMDHRINRPPRPDSHFGELDRIRLREDEFSHTTHDAPLEARGLASLASFFTMWKEHHQRVLGTIPEDEMLIVKTSEIVDRVPDIAAFVGVPPNRLRADLGRQFASPTKYRMLSKLDRSYVDDTAQRICGDLMDRLYPGESRF
jgi:hypothetical protein